MRTESFSFSPPVFIYFDVPPLFYFSVTLIFLFSPPNALYVHTPYIFNIISRQERTNEKKIFQSSKAENSTHKKHQINLSHIRSSQYPHLLYLCFISYQSNISSRYVPYINVNIKSSIPYIIR